MRKTNPRTKEVLKLTHIKHELAVAAIQTESVPGTVRENLSRATGHVEQAARDGAELVVLPELFSCGYIPNAGIWNYGEAGESVTLNWLRETAGRLGIHLGVGLLEIIGGDYVNTFVIAGPSGEIAGRAQKDSAESYCFKRGLGAHIIELPFGRIGVGICADNHYTKFIEQMRQSGIDLLLMPHASPTPAKAAKAVSAGDVARAQKESRGFAALVAGLLKVPTVFVNPLGRMAPMAGLLGKLMDPDVFRLQGGSAIVDSGGVVKAALEDREGIAMAKVALGPSGREYGAVPNFDGWIHPGSALVRKVIIPLDTFFGALLYRLSPRRRRTMRRILARHE